MILYLIRHGETDYNRQKRYQGHTDIPLNQAGRAQAGEVAGQLEHSFDEVFSSPLQRAVETARIVSGYPEAKIQTDERLKEIFLGEYEGKEYRDVDCEFRKFFDEPENYTGVHGAESFESLFTRVGSFLNDMADKYGDTEKNILVVSHGAAIHAMLLLVNDLERKDFWKIPVGNCAMIPLAYSRSEVEDVPKVQRYQMLM